MTVRRKRTVLLTLGIGLALLLLALILLPFWLQWPLRPLLEKSGVTYEKYERSGYNRIALKNVYYTKNGTTFSADRIELFQPLTWLWKLRAETNQNAFAEVSNWHLEISKNPKTQGENTSVYEAVKNTENALVKVAKWLPRATLRNGDVIFENRQFEIPSAAWNQGRISGEIFAPQMHERFFVNARTSSNALLTGEIRTEPLGAKLEFSLTEKTNQLNFAGRGIWESNRIDFSAQFERDDLLPHTAELHAPEIRISSDLLRLEGYEDLTGSLEANWRSNHFALRLNARAAPQKNSDFSPVKIVLNASGSTNRFRIEDATVSTPWLKAELSHDVELDFRGKLLSPEAALKLNVDLSRQKFIAATGHFTGEAFLQRTEKRFPKADFDLSSSGFQGFGLRINQMNLRGTMDWPWIEIKPSVVWFSQGADVQTKARFNAVSREISDGHLEWNGPPERALLPAEISVSNLVVAVDFSGPLQNLNHSGRGKISGLNLPNLKPLEISAQWNGEFLKLRQFEARAAANNAALDFAGAAQISTNVVSLKLGKFTLSKTNETRLALEKPAAISLRKNSDFLTLQMEPITLRGGNRLLSLQGQTRWPKRGRLAISAENLNAAEAQNFFSNALPDLQLSDLKFSGGWTNGPLGFQAKMRGAINFLETNNFAFSVQAKSATNGIFLEKFTVLHEGNPVLAGNGILPAQIFPAARTNQIQIRASAPIDFRADTMPNTIFWDRIAALAKVKVREPELHIAVSGTLEKPLGTIHAKIAQAQWAAKNPTQEIPALTDIRAEIALNEEKVRLDELSFLVEGQPFFAQAVLPIGDVSKNWETAFDLRKASGRIWASDIEFAAFEKFTPGILVPQGRLQLDVAFAPNFQLDGTLKIENAATRPLPGTGPLNDLQAELRFVGRRIVFEKTAALLGGQPVGISGELDFAQRRGELPLIDLHLLGDNVPLARQPEIILRGDLNLRLSNVTNATPLISGEVHLRDSLYLGDLKQLVPGHVASAKNRPPYFSVTNKTFANWRARVLVTGENFLKVRSPIFDGSISSNMRIVGTLREPFALGDMQVESGIIKFPFANFKTTQAFVTLTSEDPYRPRIFATATSRAFGYDLQLQLTGPVNQPIIEFSSTPPLTSEQIILMVTAGEVPNRKFDISTQQRAQKLALFLGKSLLSRFSNPNGAERLTITSGEEVTERGGETYGVEYKINDDWSIVGEYDRFGELNIGVKWRVYSK